MSILFKHNINWKYAIGEVVLIFIGITLAIAFNNWNEDRKQMKQGRDYVREIYRELVKDEITVESNLNFFKMQSESTRIFLSYFEQPDKEITDTLWFSQFFGGKDSDHNVLNSVYIDRPKSTWDDLLSTGKLRILGEETLVDTLRQYYVDYDYLVTNYNGFPKEYIYKSRDEVFRMLDLESVNEWWYEEEPDLPTGTFIRKIRSNIELKTHLYSILGTSKAQKIWFSKLLESTRSIIEYMEENHSDKIESY